MTNLDRAPSAPGWESIGRHFSCRRLKTTTHWRINDTGEVCRPNTDRARCDSHYAAYCGKLPVGVLVYYFGSIANTLLDDEDPALFYRAF